MKSAGFTLIELLVALAIFAIISAIAVPLYTDYTQRGYRTEVMSDLLVCAQALERFNAINFTYVGANPGGDGTPLDSTVCSPNSVAQGRYSITAVTTATNYELTALPTGPMAGDGALTLDEAGNRTWDEGNDGLGVADNDWEQG